MMPVCSEILDYYKILNNMHFQQQGSQCARVHLQGPFRDAYLTPQKQLYNQSMNSVRTSVEWLFADVQNYFKFIDFKKNLKVGLSSVGKMYVVSALLRNALTCLYGNETSQYFQLDPPSLQDYFV